MFELKRKITEEKSRTEAVTFEIWTTGCRKLGNGRIGADFGGQVIDDLYSMEMDEDSANEFVYQMFFSLVHYKMRQDFPKRMNFSADEFSKYAKETFEEFMKKIDG